MSAGVSAGHVVFVEREGVDGLAMGGLRLRAEVEHPSDLCSASVGAMLIALADVVLTETIDSSMKPAPAASIA